MEEGDQWDPGAGMIPDTGRREANVMDSGISTDPGGRISPREGENPSSRRDLGLTDPEATERIPATYRSFLALVGRWVRPRAAKVEAPFALLTPGRPENGSDFMGSTFGGLLLVSFGGRVV